MRGSIIDLERRAVLGRVRRWSINSRSGDVGMTKPLLHLGDVGLVVEGVGGGGPQRMRTDLEAERARYARISS